MVDPNPSRHHRIFNLSLLAAVAALAFLAAPGPARAAGAGGTITGEVVAKPKHRAGVIVYLDHVAGTFRPPVRPAVMDQKGMTFIPHVLAVLRGTTVRFKNNDAVSHNVFSPDGETYNLGTWGQGESRTYTFRKSGIYHQLCKIHPEMGAVIDVLDNPYFAVTGDDGKFKIEEVPPGSYTLKTWSEKGHPQTKKVTVTAGGTVDVRLDLGR